MKRLFALAGSICLLISFGPYGARTFAAHQGAPAAAAALPVRLCASMPIGVPGDAHIVRGMWNGLELANSQWRSKFRKAGMNLLSPKELNDGKADGSAVDPDKEGSNARVCLDDSAAMGSLGTLNSSMEQVSEPILDRSGMAVVNPANSNPILTSPLARHIYEPSYANHTLKYPTYYRLVTTDNLQGAADAVFMAKVLKLKKLFRVDDGQTYGLGLANKMSDWNASQHLGLQQVGSGRVNTTSSSAIATTASAIATHIVSSKPTIVFCGCDEPYAYPVEKAARRDGYKGYYLAGDAIFDPSFLTFVGASQTFKTYASFFGKSGAFAAKSFRTAYHRRFRNFSFGPYDAISYDAANLLLDAIYKAKKAGRLRAGMKPLARHASILPYIKNGTWKGVTNIYKFDGNGDSQRRPIYLYKSSVKGRSASWTLAHIINNLPKSLKSTP